MACSTGCPTKDHINYGDCLRSKRLEVSDPEAHRRNKSMYAAVDNYVDARYSGMQPATVFPKDVAFARAETERTGVPFRADK